MLFSEPNFKKSFNSLVSKEIQSSKDLESIYTEYVGTDFFIGPLTKRKAKKFFFQHVQGTSPLLLHKCNNGWHYLIYP
jgi:hypothetical protein